MNCPKCKKVLAFTRPIMPSDDAVACQYCMQVISSDEISWSDGLFHFDIMGEVPTPRISPKILMKDQKAEILDLEKIHQKAVKRIASKPNIRAICSEFGITAANLKIIVLEEK